jgi:hypothetical protein
MILFGFSNSTSPIAAFKPSAFTLMSWCDGVHMKAYILVIIIECQEGKSKNMTNDACSIKCKMSTW